MTSVNINPVQALGGAWLVLMVIGALLTYLVSVLLLWFYRRAVQRGMKRSLKRVITAADTVTGRYPPPKPLRFVLLGANAAPRAALSGPWPAAAVYLAAGAAYASIVTAAWFLAHGLEIAPMTARFSFGFFWIFYWPAILAVIVVAAQDWAQKTWIVLGYIMTYIAFVGVTFAPSPSLMWMAAAVSAQIWILENGPATVLLYLSLMRRIRAVGPIVLVFAVIALAGFFIVIFTLGLSEAVIRTAERVGGAVRLGGTVVFVATLLLSLLSFLVLGWLILRWIGARYSAKKFSDESLTVDLIFALFAVNASVNLVVRHWLWIATGVVAFTTYKVAAVIGFRLLPRATSPKRMLLLRVFALGKRSQLLFDAIRKAWLRSGAITMIAGPDLVTSAVEPDEFLGFLSGKLGRTFVGDDADIDHRVAAMDSRPDPGGRYRVAEFFCRADTWKPTMHRLVAESDAVLMDLRSFSASNHGCVYELGRLLDTIELGRVVFVTDKTTDRVFLEAMLQQQWSSLAGDSPNRSSGVPTARFFELSKPSAAVLRALIAHLASS